MRVTPELALQTSFSDAGSFRLAGCPHGVMPLHSPVGMAAENPELAHDEPAAAVGEDRRTTGLTCPSLLFGGQFMERTSYINWVEILKK